LEFFRPCVFLTNRKTCGYDIVRASLNTVVGDHVIASPAKAFPHFPILYQPRDGLRQGINTLIIYHEAIPPLSNQIGGAADLVGHTNGSEKSASFTTRPHKMWAKMYAQGIGSIQNWSG
jgi:hypothetical protein